MPSGAIQGHLVSEETRKKISKALQGHKGNFKGVKHSSQTIQRMRDSQRKRWSNYSDDNRYRPSEVTKEKIREGVRRKFSIRRETSIEKPIRLILLSWGILFIQEKKFTGIGFVDFYLPNQYLVIECDGGYWHSSEEAKKKDSVRDSKLRALGIGVLRLSEKDIKEDLPKIMELIYSWTVNHV